ncbi:MAG: hypothetical protein WCC17_07560 [Candidatus Nitrosopolaris sp.]
MTSNNFPLARFDTRNLIPQMKRKVKADVPCNFFEYLESLFSQHIKDIRDHNIREKGQFLRKTRRAQLRMNAQDRSELNITALLLPERYKLSPYYQTLSSEMNGKDKALVMRRWLERTRKNPDKFNPINKRTNLQRSVSDNFLSYILFHYYGRLSKSEMYVCREILYAIWDSGDGIYDNIVSKLKENIRQNNPQCRQYNTTFNG